MSPLSIRSMIGFLGRQYHYRTISDRDLLRKALMTEDALRKWRAKYPGDPWLPPTFFHLEQLYGAVQTEEARKHATGILKDVVRYYPDTKEGHLSRLRLAQGFPALMPETPLVIPSATPAPQPSVEPAGSQVPATPLSTPQGSGPSGSPQGSGPSGTPQGSGPSATPQASGPSGAPQANGPSSTPQASGPSGCAASRRPIRHAASRRPVHTAITLIARLSG
jgi:hypothetical protein